jgi:ribosomal-protein-alanine N-acetyltransferase
MPPDIATPRLILRVLSPAVDAALSGDVREASRRLGADVPDDLLGEDVLTLAQNGVLADSAYAPWAPRAVILRETNAMVGHIGFHTRPDPEYLRRFARDAVEVGYTIFAAHRRHGYAREALAALMAWASTEHGIRNFVASISPDNLASLGVVRGFEFVKVEAHIDEREGTEDIFLRHAAPTPSAAS